MARRRRSLAGFALLLLVILILTHPQSTYTAAFSALATWWQVVLPALLPFFLTSNLLGKLGMIQFLGVFLEPVTRPLFRLPGTAALVIAMGFSSGPPVAASLVAELRRQNLLSREEGEKLLCFAHNASPLFMLGAIGVGMLGNASLGVALAFAHYLANITLGLLWRWYGREERGASKQRGGYWRRAWTAMLRAQEKENRPLASLMAEAVLYSFKTLALVGGYIVAAAVFLALLRDLKILPAMAHFLGLLLVLFSLPPSLGEALVEGIVEMTLGTQEACRTAVPLPDRLIVTIFILGWSGVSVHGQVASVLAGTDVRLTPFILSRLAQGLLAALYLPLFLPASVPALSPLPLSPGLPWMAGLGLSLRLLGLSLAAPVLLALFYHAARRFWPGGP